MKSEKKQTQEKRIITTDAFKVSSQTCSTLPSAI